MKTQVLGIFLAAATTVVVSGCGSTDPLGEVTFKETRDGVVNEKVIGHTLSNLGHYPGAGALLYDDDGEPSGYVTSDGYVFKGPQTMVADGTCGGDAIGQCDDAQFDEDGVLVSNCVIEADWVENMGYAYRSFPCAAPL